MKLLERIWIEVRRGENIDLYATIIVAFGLVILNLVGLAPGTWIAPVTLAVLGLLAISVIGTRYHTEESLRKFTASSASLVRRAEVPGLRTRGQSASEIVIVGISLLSVVSLYLDFYEQKMKDGVRLRFLLLNPESPAVETWHLISKVSNVQDDIRVSLKSLHVLQQMEKTTKGRCEVRLAPVFLPVSLVIYDPEKETGYMSVEIYSYKATPGERPNVVLTRARDSIWFEYFRNQYENLWTQSVIWNPQ